MWLLIFGFGCNLIMQTISYSFYKNAKHMNNIDFDPEQIQINEDLFGYRYEPTNEYNYIILFFGGSNYIAYNSIGQFGRIFNVPFISADYYGSQKSKGKMNLKSMQNTAIDLYDWAKKNYPNKKIIVMGHSYGTGVAAYLASERNCDKLFLLAAYRDLSDLYNKIIPIFCKPNKIFISNNIKLSNYAKKGSCDTFIIGSNSDKTLSVNLQYKVQSCFSNAEIKIFDNVSHEDYLKNSEVIAYIKQKLVNNKI